MKHVVFNNSDGKQRVPVKIWSQIETVEPAAIQQLRNVASLPFVFKHVSAMPDVHSGIGSTVGSVVATKGAVVPALIGVDIGCGMMAVRLGIPLNILKDKAKEIRSSIERSVPVGKNSHKTVSDSVREWSRWKDTQHLYATANHKRGADSLIATAMNQMGTLGGGNHFIELCEDTEGHCWVMLHSGSRNIGKSLAEIHIDRAKADMKRMFISLPDPDLAYYAEDTDFYNQYMYDLQWAQDYAFANRKRMMQLILRDISYAIGWQGMPVPYSSEVNCHHNYASRENHYGENVLITRKGAVRAREGDLGIIPGSMGTRSYIVRGLGNVESFHSCSHGAGRKMSRTEAKRRFTVADLIAQTDGIECRKDEDVIDEIPGAYKSIDEVMENQKDLVEVVAQLKQFLCIKG